MRQLYRVLLAITLVGGSAAAWMLPDGFRDEPPESPAPDPRAVRRQAIAFHEKRLDEDPHSALDMAQLAAFFMEEGRAMADDRAFMRAESLSRRSLTERTRKNGRSMALLVNALLAQHRFGDAATTARKLVVLEPDEPAYRALLAETLLELGDYEAAIRQLGQIARQRANLGIAPRFARWAELTGQIAEARRILRAAQQEASMRVDLTAEQRAWFALRLADLELRHGNLRAAGAAIDAGLHASPRDWRLLLALARLEAAHGSWQTVSRYADEVIAQAPVPEAFALAASAKRALGMNEDAEALEAALEGLVGQAGALHRNWAFALLEQGRSVEPIIAAVAADTLVRQDVHTLDLLAWALHRAGRSAKALPLARRAMRTGIVEPSLRYHAGVIEMAAGDPNAAREHLKVAAARERSLTGEQRAELRRLVSRHTLARRN